MGVGLPGGMKVGRGWHCEVEQRWDHSEITVALYGGIKVE